MSSVLRSVRKRKKGRTLGAVDVIDREGYAELEVDADRSLIPRTSRNCSLGGDADSRRAPWEQPQDVRFRRSPHGARFHCGVLRAPDRSCDGAATTIGLSGSTVSRAFIQASATKLRELQERDLSGEDVVALARRSPRRRWSSRWASHGGQTVPGLCRDGHRERAGVDGPWSAGPRCLPGAAGDRRWRQGAPGGRRDLGARDVSRLDRRG